MNRASTMHQASARHTICMFYCSVILFSHGVSLSRLSAGHLPFLDPFAVFESQVEKEESSSFVEIRRVKRYIT